MKREKRSHKSPLNRWDSGTQWTRRLDDAKVGNVSFPPFQTADKNPNRTRSAKGKRGRKKGPEPDAGPTDRRSSIDVSAERGPFVVSAAFQQGWGVCAGRSEVALETGATGNLACLECIRSHNGLLKKSGYDAAVPAATLARLEFGDG